MIIRKPGRFYPPITTVGKAVEAQFDAMDRDLSHITPRNMRVYNQIVAMTKMLPKRGTK